MTYMAIIEFSNKKLSGWKINVLTQEFIKRRKIAVDILNPMYEKWNKEFNDLYPGKDGYSDEYSDFIRSKQKDAINIANAKSIGMNYVKLYLDERNVIFGICGKWDTTIELLLVEE